MSLPLAGKHALVTGAGRGIGAAAAHSLAAQGARLTLLGRDDARLNERVAELRASAEVQAVRADVADQSSVRRAFEHAASSFGPVAILVNNAGIARSRAFSAMDETLWDEVLSVNLTGTFLCCLAAVPGMIEARSGRIVNVASTAGLVGGPYISAYTAAKHGVVGLTRSLAAELIRWSITVNAVCPGFTETDMLSGAVANISEATGRSAEDARAALAATNAMHRFVAPQEVASTVTWLCLPEQSAISGQAIVVAGGEARPG